MWVAHSQWCTSEEALKQAAGDDGGNVGRQCQWDLEDDQQKPRQHVNWIAAEVLGHWREHERSHSKSEDVHGQPDRAHLRGDIEAGRELLLARAVPTGAEAAGRRLRLAYMSHMVYCRGQKRRT